LEKFDDKIAIEALRQGDRKVFDALFRAYYEPLCNYACAMSQGDMDEAQDIVQERFFKLWEKRAEIDITYSIKSYLYKMVYNACLNRIRHEKTKAKYKLHNAHFLDENPDYQLDTTSEIQNNVQRAIATLPDQCRHVFELNRFEELKYREIAEHLNISIKTVENHIGKALRLLREQLAEYIVSLILFETIFFFC
jgi:RNA polymerase sigma-70 factor, ECF subfamily